MKPLMHASLSLANDIGLLLFVKPLLISSAFSRVLMAEAITPVNWGRGDLVGDLDFFFFLFLILGVPSSVLVSHSLEQSSEI